MMAKYVFLVMTNPTSPEQEAEYNRWYGTDHYRDVLGVPGFVAAQRFRLAPVQYDKSGPDRSQEAGDVGKHPYRYLSLYEIETLVLPGSWRSTVAVVRNENHGWMCRSSS